MAINPKRNFNPHPPNWASDSLSEFIETAHQNIFATFVNFKPAFTRLQKIDEAFRKAIDYLHNTREWFVVFFILKAHSAYLGGARLSTSGQTREAFMVLRGCLEAALYGFYFHRNPKKVEMWMRRHDSEKSKKAVRNEFVIGKMLALLENEAPKAGKIMRELYERTIDYGAHPNEMGLTSNLRKSSQGSAIRFDLNYLAGDTISTRLCLKTNAQVGFCALIVFKEVFRERFDIMGLTDEITKLGRGL